MIASIETRGGEKDVPVVHLLGGWSLAFDPGGTLVHLAFGKGPSLLHRSDYRFDLMDGRIFHPRGWDECFPTIEPHGRSGVMGRLVGCAPDLVANKDEVAQEWTMPDMAASRKFSSPAECELLVRFEAENAGPLPLEYLWASHALFSVEGLLRVVLAHDHVLTDFSLDGTCSKFFVSSSGPVTLEREESVVTLSADQPFWGIWLNRGGWPAGAPADFRCIGIEATNSAAEIPTGAVLQANEIFRGFVKLRIEPRKS